MGNDVYHTDGNIKEDVLAKLAQLDYFFIGAFPRGLPTEMPSDFPLEDMVEEYIEHGKGIEDLDCYNDFIHNVKNKEWTEWYCHLLNRSTTHRKIEDLSILELLPNLKELGIFFQEKIQDFSVIGNLKQLKVLTIEHSGLRDISFLCNLRALEELNIKGNFVDSQTVLSFMKQCPNCIVRVDTEKIQFTKYENDDLDDDDLIF